MFTSGMTLAFVLASYGALAMFAVMLGNVMSTLMRLHWSGHSATADAALAVSVALVCVVATGLLNPDTSNGVIWIGVLSLLSVVLRRLGRFVVGRRATPSR
jgi:hypothetical protein